MTVPKDWDLVNRCSVILLNYVVSLSFWNCVCEAPLAETWEANTVFARGGCIWFTNGVWEVHKPVQRRQTPLQSTSRALPPWEWCPQKPRSRSRTWAHLLQHLPYALHAHSPRQEAIFFFKSNCLHNLSWSCLSYWQLFLCSSLCLAARTGRTSSGLRFCLPHCANFLSANKVI